MNGRRTGGILAAGGDHTIEQGVHVRIKLSQGRRKYVVSVVMDYCILAVFTKTYNKWYICEKRK